MNEEKKSKYRRKRHKIYIKNKKQKERMAYINSLPIIQAVSFLDNKLFLKIFKTERKNIIKKFMRGMSRLGDGYVWAILSLYFFISGIPNASLYFTRAIISVFLSIITFLYIKKFVRRLRPYKKHFKKPFMLPPDIHSFPSGHTMVSFAMSMSMGTYSINTAIIFYIIAILIGYSRIFVGLHYPFDVIVGIIIGTIISFINNIAFYLITGLPILGHI